MYRVRKFARRHRAGVAAAALVLLAIVAGGIAATVGFTRAVRAEHEARREAATAKQVSEFLVNLFAASGPDRARGQTMTARTLLEEGTRRIQTTMKDDAAVRARLLTAMGTAHLNLALDEQGLALLREALATVNTGGPRNMRLVVRQLFELAHGLRVAGKRGDPEIGELMERARAMLAKSPEANADLLALCLRVQGAFLNDRGERGPADSLLALAITIAESASPPDTFELISMHASRGTIADYGARYGDEERLFLRALALSEASDRWPSWTVNLHQRLATFYGQHADTAKAMAHADSGVTLARQIYPPDHPGIATALNGKVEAFISTNRLHDAIAVEEEAVAILRRSGREADLANPLNTLGILYLAVGDADRAVARSEESWRIRVKSYGVESLRAVEVQLNLARALATAGRTVRADSAFRQVITIYDRLDPTSIYNGHACGSYANLLRDAGRFAEADRLYDRAEGLFDSTDVGLRRSLATYVAERGYLRSLEKRHADAEAMIDRAFRMWRGDTSDTGSELASISLTWAAARARGGNLNGAREKLREARELGVTDQDVARFDELAALRVRSG
jgi:tetratricopeptide (TPR) repeat protein